MGNKAISVHNDRDGRQQETFELRTKLVVLRSLAWARILLDAKILYKMDGEQGKTGCPEIKGAVQTLEQRAQSSP